MSAEPQSIEERERNDEDVKGKEGPYNNDGSLVMGCIIRKLWQNG